MATAAACAGDRPSQRRPLPRDSGQVRIKSPFSAYMAPFPCRAPCPPLRKTPLPILRCHGAARQRARPRTGASDASDSGQLIKCFQARPAHCAAGTSVCRGSAQLKEAAPAGWRPDSSQCALYSVHGAITGPRALTAAPQTTKTVVSDATAPRGRARAWKWPHQTHPEPAMQVFPARPAHRTHHWRRKTLPWQAGL